MESCALALFLPAPLLQIDVQRIFMIQSSIKFKGDVRLLADKSNLCNFQNQGA